MKQDARILRETNSGYQALSLEDEMYESDDWDDFDLIDPYDPEFWNEGEDWFDGDDQYSLDDLLYYSNEWKDLYY